MAEQRRPFGILKAVRQPMPDRPPVPASPGAPSRNTADRRDVGIRPEPELKQALQRGAETDSRAMTALVRLLDEKADLAEELERVRAERDALAAALGSERAAAERNRQAMLEVLADVEDFRQRLRGPLALPAPGRDQRGRE